MKLLFLLPSLQVFAWQGFNFTSRTWRVTPFAFLAAPSPHISLGCAVNRGSAHRQLRSSWILQVLVHFLHTECESLPLPTPCCHIVAVQFLHRPSLHLIITEWCMRHQQVMHRVIRHISSIMKEVAPLRSAAAKKTLSQSRSFQNMSGSCGSFVCLVSWGSRWSQQQNFGQLHVLWNGSLLKTSSQCSTSVLRRSTLERFSTVDLHQQHKGTD